VVLSLALETLKAAGNFLDQHLDLLFGVLGSIICRIGGVKVGEFIDNLVKLLGELFNFVFSHLNVDWDLAVAHIIPSSVNYVLDVVARLNHVGNSLLFDGDKLSELLESLEVTLEFPLLRNKVLEVCLLLLVQLLKCLQLGFAGGETCDPLLDVFLLLPVVGGVIG